MRITWKDGATTLATAGAVLLERAHFYGWDWPLVSDVQWVVFGIAVLLVISYVFGYVLDSTRSTVWNWAAGLLAAGALIIMTLGLIFATSDYAVLLMAVSVVFWVGSLVAHSTVHRPSTHGHTFA